MLAKKVFVGVGLVAVGLVAGLAIAPLVRAQSSTTPSSGFTANFSLMQEVYQAIVQNYYVPVNQSALVQGGISGMTNSLNDPYTDYYTPSQYQQFVSDLNGQYAGIGAELGATPHGSQIVTVFPGTPAAKAGVKPGDVFLKVNGKDVTQEGPDNVAAIVRGNAGTTVTIEFQRGSSTYTVKITRAEITIPTATAKMLPGNIGYISLFQFSSNAASAFQNALDQLTPHHPKGYVIDLRGNPGGYVNQAVSIAQKLIPNGKIATLQGHNFPAQVYTSSSGKSLGVPIVVLVDGGTASAAEILSAAISQNHAGRLVGTQTFGKGIAQDVIPMAQGGDLKITVAQWMTPDGGNIEHHGLAPSYVVTGPSAPLIAAESILGGNSQMTASLQLGSRWIHAGGQATEIGHKPLSLPSGIYLSAGAVETAIGANVTYVASQGAFEIELGTKTLTLSLGNPSATVNGRSVQLTPAMASHGEQYIPLSDLERVYGVQYHAGANGTFTLTTSY